MGDVSVDSVVGLVRCPGARPLDVSFDFILRVSAQGEGDGGPGHVSSSMEGTASHQGHVHCVAGSSRAACRGRHVQRPSRGAVACSS